MPDPIDPNAGGAGNPPSITPDNPDVQKLIQQAVKDATSGLAANKDEILGEKKKLQEQLDQMAKTWEGLDPEAVRNIMQRLEGDEETKLLAEGKTDEVIARRTERLQADHKKQLEKLQAALEERDSGLSEAQKRVKQLTVSHSLQRAASELGLIPSAIDDALARAMNVFQVDDKGSLTVQENGATVYGKDGKNPMTPGEWLEAMKEKAPHWFPAPSGGGAAGGAGGRGGKHQITREQARDPQIYRAAKKAAEDAGATLQIVSG
ncbi:MAG TPA: hypothetical protein VIG24_13100 [Acidimicrobiia bacterium]